MNKSAVDLDPRIYAAIRDSYEHNRAANPDAEVCPTCKGLGAITLDVPIDHPAFGKSFRCPCQNGQAESQSALSKVEQASLPSKPIRMSQVATSEHYRMDIAVGSDLEWYYDPLTTELHGIVLGMTGSGKTNSVYRIVEQIQHAGGLVTIVDPEGDYRFLKAEFPVLIAGKGRKGNPIDLPVTPDSAYLLARALASRNVSIILDISGYDEEAKNEFVASYVGELWRAYQDEDLPPMRLVIDEVQLFAPQNTQTASKKLILDIASRGRKRHLALLVATQRPQRVDKTLLDGMDIRIFHRLKRGTALNAVRELLPYQLGDVAGKEILSVFADMVRGQATFEMEGLDPMLVQIKLSDTYHPDSAPATLPLPIATVDADLIAELRRALGAQGEPVINPGIISTEKVTELNARIAELEAENAELHKELLVRYAEIEDLRAQAPVQQLPLIEETGQAETEYRSPLATTRAIHKQEREFAQLIKSLGLYPRHHRAMLKFLLEYEDSTYTIYELARFTGYGVSTIANSPPLWLIQKRLIWRQKGRKPLFRSTARVMLQTNFPDLNTDGLIGELLKACR